MMSLVPTSNFHRKWTKYEIWRVERLCHPLYFIKCERCGDLESCRQDQLAAKRYCADCKASLDALTPSIRRAMVGMRLPPAATYTCIDCGDTAAVWEHRNYDRPHEVVATCHPCNKLRGPATWTVK